MRIMIVTDQYPPMVGGVPTVAHGLAVNFARRGHQVWVIAPSYGARDVQHQEQNVHVYRFSSFEWPTYKDLRISYLPFMAMHNLIKKFDPDIIHLHSPIVLGSIAQMLAGSLRKPVVVTNHYLPINLSRSLATDPFLGKYISRITYSYLIHFCNRCVHVTAPTLTALNLLYEHGLRVPATVISNGIDLKRFSPQPRDLQLLQRLNLPTDRPLILHVNRLSEEKRVNILLDAIAKMKTNAHLALAGSGPALADLQAQVERLQISNRVSFLGFVPDADLPTLLCSADLFVIPSEADLQSVATMEAMACGLPVVAANSYALPELVHHAENGFLFQPGDSTELAYAIDQTLDDAALRARMGAQSLKIIAAHDYIEVLNEWEKLYERLVKDFKTHKSRQRRFYQDHRSSATGPQETHNTGTL